MNAFLVSLATVAFAEIGDRTQLLSLCLAAHYRRPWPILAGILAATLVNHALAGAAGAVLARFLTPLLLDTLVGASMVAMALWTLKPDAPGGEDVPAGGHGIFLATLAAFFVAEIGDKTQIATLTLAAAYPNLIVVVAGTTSGMMLANLPVVFLGGALAGRLPVRRINYAAATIFAVLGALFLARAFALWHGAG